jgi:pseudaminic acid cytidylyltransferase
MKSLAIIPARGGSKRIPRKNIKLFDGRPIIAYSIYTARRSKLFDRILVSTDDEEIAQVATDCGAGVIMRPAELADDITGTQDVMKHAAEVVDRHHFMCCIYPTSPLMHEHDLIRGYRMVQDYNVDFAFSVGTEPLRDAGMFYWGTWRSFLEGRTLYSDRTRIVPINEKFVCDINTPEDWARAERMYATLKEERNGH